MLSVLAAEPRFRRWAFAEGVSMVGSAVSGVVIPVLAYDLTGSAGIAGLTYAARLVPYLMFGWIAGPIADRSDRRRLIIGGNVVEGVLAASVPIAALAGTVTIGHLFAVILLSRTAYVFSDAAVFGAIPAIVDPERLPAANGFLSAFGAIAETAGPAVAGVLIATIGSEATLWIDAASFVIAAAVQRTIRSTFRREDAPVERRPMRSQLAAAVAFMRRQRTVAVLVIAGFGNSIAIGTVLGLLVPWSVEVLGYGNDDGRLGLLYAGVGVGGFLSGALFARVFSVDRVRLLTPASLAWSSVCAGSMAVATAWWAPLVVVSFSFGIMLTITIGITYRQLVTPDDLTSTVNALGRMIAAGGQPLGAALGAGIATVASVRGAYTVAAGALVATAAASAIALRSSRHSPTGAVAE